ncbi:hypothetical protein [Thalassotalea litorea]|uniref:hypothetical protein n=1 Tax=Thalassotalea litorea TaxID=2020715 RepID=UPI003736F0CC
MPAYATIEFEILRKNLTETLVKEFYDAMFVHGLNFEKVFVWGCDENLKIDDIIAWNQEKLNDNFKLGFTQDISHNYRQILICGTPYSECRLFITNYGESFSFHVIVPEDEMHAENIDLLLKASENVWNALPIEIIQSYGELNDSYKFVDIQSANEVSIEFFAFTSQSNLITELKNKHSGCASSRGFKFVN